jgi:DNA-binding Xre family transcriptional regulator
MVRLCIREVAQQQGLRLSEIQREARLSITTARRYWYNSRSGLARDAGTLSEINLATLGAIAALLNVKPGELLEASE